MSPLLAATGPSAYWYLTRSTGAVALILLTLALALGVVDVRRWSSETWPRFVVDSLHRNVSLLALAFLCLHILTAVLDSFAPISLVNAVIPFTGTYRPFWLGLGALSFDLILAVIVTSLLRRADGPFDLASRPLAHLCELADRTAAWAGYRQRREKHLDAGDQHRLFDRGDRGSARARRRRLA